ncbi:TIGR03862 family flavoprotein [Methylibium sp.]|uniref:TIGR03862 family flavoprotein n=1 Tax=Methylibium sp. TaxID=2067992 RepID=UPI0018301FE7|nr:TIGR03862 family flavoprotein [Methylibium sp.]MBA3588619.1 TIGR03862 family flavoprotein [Methylibium sp.]
MAAPAGDAGRASASTSALSATVGGASAPSECRQFDGDTPAAAKVAVIGGGPAGLMAAEELAAGGARVDLYDAMPSVGRKFLLAGKGGLNLTHGEPLADFGTRYGPRAEAVGAWLEVLPPSGLRDWADGLGISTFVGSSGRVFPTDLKAAPLLRAWLHRLRTAGVGFHSRHRWEGWSEDGALRFATPQGERAATADAVVLALGGASWPQLGSDGAWVAPLAARGVEVAPLLPSNCGFDVGQAGQPPGWSAHFRERFAGAPIKPVVLAFTDRHAAQFRRQGEFVVTATGIEGSLVYAASSALRDEIAAQGAATIHLDLLPDRSAEFVAAEVGRPRGARTLATQLRSRLGITGVKAALLYEVLGKEAMHDPVQLAAACKALPLRLVAPRPIAEAISTAGGVRLPSLDERLMLRAVPGVFCAGEMLDWEAPTGGYLITASMASGRVAGQGALDWLASNASTP